MSLGWLSGLLILFCISFLGSAPVPLPLTATVLWLGQFKTPVAVLLVGTLGSLLGWLSLDGVLKRWVQRQPQVVERIPDAYRQLFLKRLGFWLFVFNALPLPVDFMRFLALISNHSRVRLALIFTAARLVRNTLLVVLGAALAQHQLWLWLGMGVLLILPLPIQRLLQSTATVSD